MTDSSTGASLPFKPSFRVWCEMREMLDGFGEEHFSADKSMVEHWANLLATEMSDDLKAKLPETLAIIKALDEAKFVSRKILNTQIDV